MASSDSTAARTEMFRALDDFVAAFKNYATHSEDFTDATGHANGITTGKRKRATKTPKVKDPNQPKRPASSYLIFQIEKRQELKQEFPALTHQELTKIISESWAKLDEEGKKPFADKFAVADRKYKESMKDYNATKDAEVEIESPPPTVPAKKSKPEVKAKTAQKSKEIVEDSEEDDDEASSSDTAQQVKDEITPTSDEEESSSEEEVAPPPKKSKAKPAKESQVKKKKT